ncbi:MAG: hypothetical protein P4L22_05115 [Candidatus Babeliales bacterium]|nr:hypothetical protein [Candidatus Babeliales bacterium]
MKKQIIILIISLLAQQVQSAQYLSKSSKAKQYIAESLVRQLRSGHFVPSMQIFARMPLPIIHKTLMLSQANQRFYYSSSKPLQAPQPSLSAKNDNYFYKYFLLSLGISIGTVYGIEELLEHMNEQSKLQEANEKEIGIFIVYELTEQIIDYPFGGTTNELVINAYDVNNNNIRVGRILFYPSKGRLGLLQVEPSYRNIGIGTELLKRGLTELAKDPKVTTITFRAGEPIGETQPIPKDVLKHFYEKRGAQDIGYGSHMEFVLKK